MPEMCQRSRAPPRLVEFQPCKVHQIHLPVLWDRDCIQVQPSWLPTTIFNTSFPPTCYYCDFASSASSTSQTTRLQPGLYYCSYSCTCSDYSQFSWSGSHTICSESLIEWQHYCCSGRNFYSAWQPFHTRQQRNTYTR